MAILPILTAPDPRLKDLPRRLNALFIPDPALYTTYPNLAKALGQNVNLHIPSFAGQIMVAGDSTDAAENIRRWLSRPSGGQGSEARSNFFGSFVGIFVDRRIGEADKSVAFVSQWFQVGAQ